MSKFMASRSSINIQTALAWFELDKETVSAEKVKAAYRILAKQYHPDTRGNYKEKLSASENFIAATDAKDVLLEACRDGRLPTKDAGSPKVEAAKKPKEWPEQFKAQARSRAEPEKPPPKRYEDMLTGRHKYDYRNPRPMEKLMHLPYVGGIFSSVFVIGMMLATATGLLAISPFMIIYPFVERFIDTQKLGDMLTGIPLFFVYFAATYLGVQVLADGNNWLSFWMLLLVWGCLSMIALDEIYSFIRYKLISSKIRKDLAEVLEPSRG